MDCLHVNRMLAQMRELAFQAKGPTCFSEKNNSNCENSAINSINNIKERSNAELELTEKSERISRSVNFGNIMVSLEKSNMMLPTIVEVRNKLIDAYKEIMNMPV